MYMAFHTSIWMKPALNLALSSGVAGPRGGGLTAHVT